MDRAPTSRPGPFLFASQMRRDQRSWTIFRWIVLSCVWNE